MPSKILKISPKGQMQLARDRYRQQNTNYCVRYGGVGC